jgi:hypothetical protein
MQPKSRFGLAEQRSISIATRSNAYSWSNETGRNSGDSLRCAGGHTDIPGETSAEVEQPVTEQLKPEHLICRTGWALLMVAGCGYFVYRVFADISAHDYQWRHHWWNALTWAVWAVLAAGLISETRCVRERILFGVLFAQFALGIVFSLWATAPFDVIRQARWASLALWWVAALMSIAVLAGRRPSSNTDASS